MRFFAIEADGSPQYTGEIDAAHKWGLPGVEPCPTCRSGGGIGALNYPCVDLSSLPANELKKLSNRWPVPREEIKRLSERLRSLAPPWAWLEPGVDFGPLSGKGSGHFGQLVVFFSSSLLVRRAALERLRAEGLRGLEEACPPLVRFAGKSPPDLLDVQLRFGGQPHLDCVSPKSKPPCPACGYTDTRYLSPPILDAATLPGNLDVFRLSKEFSLIATERFVEALARLELDGVKCRELEAR